MTLSSTAENAIAQAQRFIAKRGKKATDKRCKVLSVLLLSDDKPLSAYDITDKYSDVFEESIIANSVYRILGWLAEAHLVHKLTSVNKFVACQHDGCLNEASISIFMICRECQKAFEQSASKEMVNELNIGANNANFGVIEPHIELSGVCKDCQS
jgi:Fur family zinc uptake transcriptional regulator